MRLYEFPEAIDDVLGRVEAAGGDLTPELQAEMDGLFADLDAKVNGVQRAIREFEALEIQAGAEASRIRGVQAVYQNRVRRLKAYLLEAMRHADIDRYVTAVGGISRCKSGTPKVTWGFSSEIPEGYRREKVEVTIDREAVLEAFRQGCLPEGFSVEYTEYLRIS